jgi:hypothetical protein
LAWIPGRAAGSFAEAAKAIGDAVSGGLIGLSAATYGRLFNGGDGADSLDGQKTRRRMTSRPPVTQDTALLYAGDYALDIDAVKPATKLPPLGISPMKSLLATPRGLLTPQPRGAKDWGAGSPRHTPHSPEEATEEGLASLRSLQAPQLASIADTDGPRPVAEAAEQGNEPFAQSSLQPQHSFTVNQHSPSFSAKPATSGSIMLKGIFGRRSTQPAPGAATEAALGPDATGRDGAKQHRNSLAKHGFRGGPLYLALPHTLLGRLVYAAPLRVEGPFQVCHEARPAQRKQGCARSRRRGSPCAWASLLMWVGPLSPQIGNLGAPVGSSITIVFLKARRDAAKCMRHERSCCGCAGSLPCVSGAGSCPSVNGSLPGGQLGAWSQSMGEEGEAPLSARALRTCPGRWWACRRFWWRSQMPPQGPWASSG